MLAACAQAGVHNLDITGEIDVFEAIFRQDQRLREAGGIAPGAATPSMAFGAEFVLAIPGVRLLT